jgi:hypothetical protein
MKYNKRIGQNTGTSKISKKVIIIAIIVARVHDSQNLNSGNRRANGLNKNHE